MSKHTPGPWTVDRTSKGWEVLPPPEVDGGVAFVFDHGNTEDNANACLIAAAPELLEALKLFADGSCDSGCADSSEKCNGCRARAAIAKAEGTVSK